jgi:hypothetical protein
VIEVENRRQEREPAAKMFRFQRVVAQEKENRGQREQPEDAVAEHRQRRVQFDPRIVAENVDPRRRVPGPDGERQEGERSGE